MYYPSDVICTNCGFINKIIRTDNFNKKKYHSFNDKCLGCGCYAMFIELGDSALVRKKLEFKPELTDVEKMILNLLDNPKSNLKTK